MEEERPGYVYIVASDELLSWAQDKDELYLFKIGFTSDLSVRLRGLNEGWIDPPGKPCLNCTDWRWVQTWDVGSRIRAQKEEKELKRWLKTRWREFDRSRYRRFDSPKPNGATEVYQIPPSELMQLDDFSPLINPGQNDFITDQIISGIARYIRHEITHHFGMPGCSGFEISSSAPLYSPSVNGETEEQGHPDPYDDADADYGEYEVDHDTIDEEIRLEHRLQTEDSLSDQDDQARSDGEGWLYDDAE